MSLQCLYLRRSLLSLFIFSLFSFPVIAEEKHDPAKKPEEAYQGAPSPIESATQVITPGAPTITTEEFDHALVINLINDIVQDAVKVSFHHRKIAVGKENLIHFPFKGRNFHNGILMQMNGSIYFLESFVFCIARKFFVNTFKSF